MLYAYKMEKLKKYSDAEKFLADCSTFLSRHEAENNLLFGIANTIVSDPRRYEKFFFASLGDSQKEGAFLMTPPHRLIISKSSSKRAMDSLIEELITANTLISGILGCTEETEYFAGEWLKRAGGSASFLLEYCYKLSSLSRIAPARGSFRKADLNDFDLLKDWTLSFAESTRQLVNPVTFDEMLLNKIRLGVCCLWEDNGEPVSMLQVHGDTPNGIRIGAVYTPAECRGRGYASSLVAMASQMQLDRGKKFCFLFAEAEYEASNRIYRRLGYEKVCEYREYDFVP